jgi:RNA polymerase sigma-70 factor (ECF subfamily)
LARERFVRNTPCARAYLLDGVVVVTMSFALSLGWLGWDPRGFSIGGGGTRGAVADAPRSPAQGAAAAAAANEAMSRYARGDDAAFAIVYDALAPRLFGYLVRQTRDQARAEDLVQQTLLHMHRARASFIAGAEVTPWAFAIARRLLIDGLRRGKREVLRATDDESDADVAIATDAAADDLVQAQQTARLIQKELARIPEAQRVAFELIKQDGLSLAEAAQVLGTTVSAVKLRAHRAYEALRVVLGDAVENVHHTEKRGAP